MDTIHFTIVTPEGRTYEDDVVKVTIPTQAGPVTIYPGHAQLISVLEPGELIIHKAQDQEPRYVAVSSGILAVRPNSVVQVLADTAEHGEVIDVERAERARARAQELLKQAHAIEDIDYARLQALIEKEVARINVGNRYRG